MMKGGGYGKHPKDKGLKEDQIKDDDYYLDLFGNSEDQLDSVEYDNNDTYDTYDSVVIAEESEIYIGEDTWLDSVIDLASDPSLT